jgi:hypothetical protein
MFPEMWHSYVQQRENSNCKTCAPDVINSNLDALNSHDSTSMHKSNFDIPSDEEILQTAGARVELSGLQPESVNGMNIL